MKAVSSRRGISTFLAVLILIAITLVAGITVYSVFFRTAGTMGAGLNAQVDVQLIKGTTTSLFSASVKNTGTEDISSCKVTVYSGTNKWELTFTGTIPVGGSKSASSTTLPAGMTLEVGKSYPVTVELTGVSGSTKTISQTVTCVG